MKQYTVTVRLRGCADESPFLVFSGYEAYQQWISGRDIHGFAKLNGVDEAFEMIVPRHAITKIELATTEAESTPAVDAFCETN